jgi:5-oxoprolinase (ATP-hydrolysing) subunit A
VACGAHAGNAATMRHAVEQARDHGVRLGAHPSYPDRANFGRVSMRLAPRDLRRSLLEQMKTLRSLAGAISHVKPHGALYNDAHHDADLARIVIEAIGEVDAGLAIVASADSWLFRAATEARLPAIAEAFGDRRYRSDGSLVPRSRPDALLLDVDAAADQSLSLAANGIVNSDDGRTIRIVSRTICIHGDMERSVERLQRIRQRLSAAGFSFAAPAV